MPRTTRTSCGPRGNSGVSWAPRRGGGLVSAIEFEDLIGPRGRQERARPLVLQELAQWAVHRFHAVQLHRPVPVPRRRIEHPLRHLPDQDVAAVDVLNVRRVPEEIAPRRVPGLVRHIGEDERVGRLVARQVAADPRLPFVAAGIGLGKRPANASACSGVASRSAREVLSRSWSSSPTSPRNQDFWGSARSALWSTSARRGPTCWPISGPPCANSKLP